MHHLGISVWVVGALIGLGACSPGDMLPSNANRITITFAARAEEQQFYDPLIATFNADNPDMRVQFIALNEAAPTIPQIVRAADTAAVFFVPPHERTETYLRNLKPLMDADAAFTRDAFYPGAFAAAGDTDPVLLVPRTLYVPLLSYNQDLWGSNGLLQPTADWTWTDLIAAAQQLSVRQGESVTRYGLLDWSAGVRVLAGELVAAGVDLSAATRLTDPAIAAALARTQAYIASGAIYPVRAMENDTLQRLITEQRVAIWPTELFLPAAQAEPLPFAVGTMPYPPLPLPAFSDAASGYIMSSGTQHPQEAWQWLAFLSCQAIGQDDRIVGAVAVPACRTLSATSTAATPLDADARAAIDAALSRPPAPPQTLLDGRSIDALGQALWAVMDQKQPPDAALDAAQRALEQQRAQPSPTPDAQPIVVATPIPLPPPPVADMQTITFAPVGVGLLTEDVNRLARVFMEQHPGIEVKIKHMDVDDSELARVAAASDCFMLYRPPRANEMTELLDLQPLMDAAGADMPPDDYPAALLAL
ncbi:MAG: extracellular solute-binding protein, partial [Chloroflexales bacterium]|nr:extracellular solute-binding protein [Chloroflexales bacterium]